MAKPKILILALHYLPGYKAGGPIRSIANLVHALKDQFEFTILTRDRDMGDFVPYPGLPNNNTVIINSAKVIYLRDDQLKYHDIKTLINTIDYDLLYLNSLFCISFTIKPLLLWQWGKIKKTPLLLAPRGELSEGGLSIKPLKKRLYLGLARLYGLYQGILWQATNATEKQQIQRVFGQKISVEIASNIFNHQVQTLPKVEKIPGVLRLVFMSRITPKKNLIFLLKLLSTVQGKVILDIYGPIEIVSYWNRCKKIIHQLPKHIHVQYKGVCEKSQVVDTLSHYHLFVLPTKSENFGHIVLESLTAGTPVLIADTTPWNHLKAQKIAYTFTLSNTQSWTTVLNLFLKMDQNAYNNIVKEALLFSKNYQKDNRIICSHKNLFYACFGREKNVAIPTVP